MQHTRSASAALLAAALWGAPAMAQNPDPHVVIIGTTSPASAQWQRIDAQMWHRVGQPSAALQWRRVDPHRWTTLPEGDPSL